jgi:AAA ATPase domain
MRCPVVVGRDEELAALAETFSRAAGGRGACVVVTGEAGVGKTRLVTEAATVARGRGQVVLVGRSTPTDRVSPLRPPGEALLDGLRDRRPPDEPALTAYLPALGTVVPHWAAGPAFPAVPPAPVALAEAMLRVVRWLSSFAPVRLLGDCRHVRVVGDGMAKGGEVERQVALDAGRSCGRSAGEMTLVAARR